jgi:hypothetical protein
MTRVIGDGKPQNTAILLEENQLNKELILFDERRKIS